MHDRFRKRYQVPSASARLRQQIAREAARRMYEAIGPKEGDTSGTLRDATEGEFYAAKRKAAADHEKARYRQARSRARARSSRR